MMGTRTTSSAVGFGRGGRMSRQRKRDAVLRLLRGEDLETVSRSLGVTAATLTAWRDSFLAAGEAALAARPTDGETLESERLKARLGDMLLKHELLEQKITSLEGGRPCMGSIMSTGFHRRPPSFVFKNGRSEAELSRTSRRVSPTRPYNLVFGGPTARTMMLHTHRERGSEGVGPVFGSVWCPRALNGAPPPRIRSGGLG